MSWYSTVDKVPESPHADLLPCLSNCFLRSHHSVYRLCMVTATCKWRIRRPATFLLRTNPLKHVCYSAHAPLNFCVDLHMLLHRSGFVYIPGACNHIQLPFVPSVLTEFAVSATDDCKWCRHKKCHEKLCLGVQNLLPMFAVCHRLHMAALPTREYETVPAVRPVNCQLASRAPFHPMIVCVWYQFIHGELWFESTVWSDTVLRFHIQCLLANHNVNIRYEIGNIHRAI